MSRWRNLVFILIIQLVCSWTCAQASFAEDVSTPQPIDLDLTSTDRNVAASTVLTSGAEATIDLATITRTVVHTDMLTASEMIAVRQVLNTGNQYLHLSDLGAATGGGFHISYYVADGINNLVIPEGVRASQNAALLQTLNLAGDLHNYGTFNVFSSDAAVTSATVNATNICNYSGAAITSTLANLNLNAVNNIINNGTITSTGSVAMTAGNSILNSGIVQALQNLSVQASTITNQAQMAATLGNVNVVTANLINSGLMQSLAGGLHITEIGDTGVILNNLNGTLSGLNLTIGGNVSIDPLLIGTIIPSTTSNGAGGSITFGSNVTTTIPSTTFTTAGGSITITSNSTINSGGGGAITFNSSSATGSSGAFSTTASSINLNVTANGSGATADGSTIVLTLNGGALGNNVVAVNNAGAISLVTESSAAPVRTATAESNSNTSTSSVTFTQTSVSTANVGEGNFVSRPVISTDITAVTPLAIFQGLPASTMSAPVSSTIMHTISGLNQVNMIPVTSQQVGTPFSLGPTPLLPNSSSTQNVPSPYQPIAYTPGAPDFEVIDNSRKELSEIHFDTCLVRHSGNSDISYQPGQINLKSGEILIHSQQRTVLTAGDYTISVDPGAVALITSENKVLTVRVLYEQRANAVAITAGNNAIKLSVGQEAMLAPQSIHLQAANQKDGVGHRHVKEATLSNGHMLSRSEFSHVGLIEQADVLTRLVHSKAPQDRQLSDKLIKIAACLMTVTGSHGAYSDK